MTYRYFGNKVTKSLPDMVSDVVDKFKSFCFDLKYSILSGPGKQDYSDESVEKTAKILEDEFSFYILENDMEYFGICNAIFTIEERVLKCKILWSRVDLNEDIEKVHLVLYGLFPSRGKKVPKSFCIMRVANDVVGGSRSSPVQLFLPEEYKKFSEYDPYYYLMLKFFVELFDHHHKIEKHEIEYLKLYEEISEDVELLFGVKLFPNSKSTDNLEKSCFISNCVRKFASYSKNPNANAIMFSKVKHPSRIEHLILLKDKLLVRKRTNSLSKLEEEFFERFEVLSKSNFNKILSTISLSAYWDIIDDWDQSVFYRYRVK